MFANGEIDWEAVIMMEEWARLSDEEKDEQSRRMLECMRYKELGLPWPPATAGDEGLEN